MRQSWVWLFFFWLGWTGLARAQSGLDMLEKELDEIQQEHQEANSETLTNFMQALQDGAASADAAVQLYQKVGGSLPDPTEVKTLYEHETPTEKAARLAQDQANLSTFGGVIQLQCGLMRIAVEEVTKPSPPDVQSEWVAWLKQAAAVYPQLTGNEAVKSMQLHDSPIAAFFNFHGWAGKDQAHWSVRGIPQYFHDSVLEPMRHPPTPEVLPVWDAYIAMMSADEPDQDKWTNVELPDLQFQRAGDDFTSAPDSEKLEAMVGLIKAHPNHPKLEQWITQMRTMIESYRSTHHGEASTNAAPST